MLVPTTTQFFRVLFGVVVRRFRTFEAPDTWYERYPRLRLFRTSQIDALRSFTIMPMAAHRAADADFLALAIILGVVSDQSSVIRIQPACVTGVTEH